MERYKLLGEKSAFKTHLKVTHPLGGMIITKMKPEGILVPTAKGLDLNGPPPDLPVTDVDHFQCYQLVKGKEMPPTKGVTLHLKDQFLDRGFTIRAPVRLCAPVEKIHDGVTTPIQHPEKHLMCYKLGLVSHKVGVRLTNQLGSEEKRTEKADELCVPSKIERLSDGEAPPDDDDDDDDNED